MQAKTTQKRSNESIIAPIFIKPLPKKSDQDVSTRTPIRSKESLKSSNGSVVYKPATNSKPAPKLKPTTRPTSSKNSIKPSSRPTSAKKQSRPTTPKTNTIKRGNILKRDSIQVTPDQRTSVIKPTERSPISHHQSTIPQIAPAVEKKSGSELSSADWTLLEACSTGNLMQVYNSLWAGANVNCKKPIYNTTPLTIASRSGFKSISSVLCEFKADVKSLDGYGASTFHWIADSNEAGILKYIFSRIKDGKSDIKKILNHRDGYGSTALHFASVRGNFDVVKELVECGADSMLLNNDGKRASQVTNDPECKSFLEFEEERILKLKRQLAEGGLAGKLTKKLKTNGIKRIKKKVVK